MLSMGEQAAHTHAKQSGLRKQITLSAHGARGGNRQV